MEAYGNEESVAMRIWLITVGEPLPIDGNNDRLLRAGILANNLVGGGLEVLWWTSSFDHVRKRQRCGTDTTKVLGDRYRITMLHANGYSNNTSLARLLNHRGVGEKFQKLSETERRPDIILCSLPTLELCVEAVRYGKRNHVPVVIDVRDLWPDLVAELAPRWGRGIAKFFLTPMFRMVREACVGAAAIIGVTPDYVAWGLRYAGRAATVWDRDFPMGYQRIELPNEEYEDALARWYARGVAKDEFIICFFGTIGRQFDLETVIGAARILQGAGRRFRFVLCGNGDRLGQYRRKAKDCPEILFPGWVDRADIGALMSLSGAGLAPYVNKPNFTMNLPNKPVEYLSAGLPVVSSLSGVLAKLISENGCGITYEAGSPESLADALMRLYDDRDALGGMSRNARALYDRLFVAERVYGKMIEHLCRIAEEWEPLSDVKTMGA
jgi:glycosyltransferase involved in cell wall biosynthesis